jgi:lipopolysaccharide export system protein LptC
MDRVITARTDAQTARAYWTMSRADSERAFRAARRHSRWVRLLRLAIPVVVLGGLGFTAMVSYFNPLRMLNDLPIGIDNVVVSGSKITMEKPRVSGYTQEGRAYDMSAVAARQDLTKPDIVELQSLAAKLQMEDQSTMQLVADKGLYNAKSEVLELEKNIVLTSKDYEGLLSQATVEIRSGHVVSKEPVQLKMLQGQLNAKQLEIKDSGDIVRFTGGVSMHFKLPPADQETKEAQAK